MAVLKESIEEAEGIINGLVTSGRALTRNEQLYADRMRFTRYSYDITSGYMSMVEAAATACDYGTAAAIGEKAIAVREELTDMNGTFTTYRGYKVEHRGYAWWPGEVRQYGELQQFIDGTHGRLIAKLPVDWAFHRDDDDTGEERGFASKPVDLSYWEANQSSLTLDSRKDYPDEWEMLSTALYAQAQGIRHPDRQSYTGQMWYRTDVTLSDTDAGGKVHIRFPGLFNACRLYVNGVEVKQRLRRDGEVYGGLWWYNDYKYEWDVDLTGKLDARVNTITLKCDVNHHFGGMFRRPFLYEPHVEVDEGGYVIIDETADAE